LRQRRSTERTPWSASGSLNVNQNPGIIGKKIGMTQIFDDKGEVVRCTVVQAGCVVIAKRTLEKDGYSALVLGLGERKEKHTSKPLAGSFKKMGQSPKRIVRELRAPAEHVATFEVGEKISVDKIFEPGQFVDAQAKSRGRGFTGVMRRWSFAGGVGSHGTHEYFRHGGSIGTNMTPGRTLPGLKMPGHYGDETVTAQNLKVAKLIVEDDLVLIAGAVPGSKDGLVTIRGAVKKKNAGKPKK
jgi:large subunit ribosomal protein L3